MVLMKVRRYQCKSILRCLHTAISAEVQAALDTQKPILALESTIITHGLPYPENLTMAQTAQHICRDMGVTPATIALIKGKVCIGVTDDQLQELSCKTERFVKLSRRDLAPAIQKQESGGTTVSATMLLANQHNIDVFATGGIGGVHREGEDTLDISADLNELGRTPVAVVCAGVKSILDIQLTLEYLETQGVTVVTLGKTREFPAFFTASSGHLSHDNVETAREAAEMIHVNKTLGLGSGIVIAVPIPAQFEADGEHIEQAIQTALTEAKSKHISGNAITPFVLKRVSELTSGRSLATNLALVKNNVTVGSQIARELGRLRGSGRRYTGSVGGGAAGDNKILVVGALNVDILCSSEEDCVGGKDLVPGSVHHALGGVARNVAECLARCGVQQTFVSVVGNDKLGRLALESCRKSGVCTDRISVLSDAPTPVAQLYLRNGDVVGGLGDFSSHSHIAPSLITEADVRGCSYVVLDCDTPLKTGLHLAEMCSKAGVPLVLEPTAPNKFIDFVEAGILNKVSMLTPNLSELESIISNSCNTSAPLPDLSKTEHTSVISAALSCLSLMNSSNRRVILSTLGDQGAVYCGLHDSTLKILHLPAAPVKVEDIKSASGAGDSFLGGFLAGVSKGRSAADALKMGTYCAFKSLQCFDTINCDLSSDDVGGIIESWEGMGWDVEVLYDGPYSL